jgi:hypothetical protein
METTKTPIQVTICGGGNGAHFSACLIGANPNYKVNVFTRRPKDWKSTITGNTKNSIWEHKGDIVGKLNLVSDDPKTVSKGSKIFLICGPAHIHQTLLEKVAPFIEKDTYVGTLYGQGGFDWMANYVLGKRVKKDNITLFGLQNIPAICKVRVYGESVNIIGPKKILYAAVSPLSKKEDICQFMDEMFQMPTVPLPNFLCLTLTPSNQIIHPGRMYGIFKDWDGKQAFDHSKIPLLYEDMDDFSADQMQKLDDEIQAIKQAILKKYPHVDLSTIIPLKERVIKQYGESIKDKTNLKTVFRTNIGYATAAVPVKKVEGGVVPNIEGRLFWEDIPYGLCILKDMASMLGVKTPATDLMIEWHQKFMNKKFIAHGKLNKELISQTGCPSRYGIKNIEHLLKVSSISPKL